MEIRYIYIKCRICGYETDSEDDYWKHHLNNHSQFFPQYVKKEYFENSKE